MSVLGELLHERRARPSFGRLVNMGGVAISVALLCGTVFWGWRVVVRDVSGVPVVRALEGPSRIAPKNPQGDIVQHQGLSVNQVQADGAAGEIAERISLAPAPGGLRDSDLAPAALAAAESIAATPDSAPIPVADTDAAVLAVLGGEVPPREIVVISADIPGVKVSPIPPKRPESLVRPALIETPGLPALNPETPAVPVVEVGAETLPAGARLVQLGSFASADEARAAWDAMARLFPDLMQDKQRVIEKGTLGATEFWRLRAAGFDSRADAQRFCAVIEDDPSRICITVASE